MERKFNIIQNTLEKLVNKYPLNQDYVQSLNALMEIQRELKIKERKNYEFLQVGANKNIKKIPHELAHLPTNPGYF